MRRESSPYQTVNKRSYDKFKTKILERIVNMSSNRRKIDSVIFAYPDELSLIYPNDVGGYNYYSNLRLPLIIYAPGSLWREARIPKCLAIQP